MVGGALALESHATKATARLAINTSPEPVSNSVASVTEDVATVSLVALALTHPILAFFVTAILIVLSAWVLVKLSRFLLGLVTKFLTFIKSVR